MVTLLIKGDAVCPVLWIPQLIQYTENLQWAWGVYRHHPGAQVTSVGSGVPGSEQEPGISPLDTERPVLLPQTRSGRDGVQVVRSRLRPQLDGRWKRGHFTQVVWLQNKNQKRISLSLEMSIEEGALPCGGLSLGLPCCF